jgi:hypothetical protein
LSTVYCLLSTVYCLLLPADAPGPPLSSDSALGPLLRPAVAPYRQWWLMGQMLSLNRKKRDREGEENRNKNVKKDEQTLGNILVDSKRTFRHVDAQRHVCIKVLGRKHYHTNHKENEN